MGLLSQQCLPIRLTIWISTCDEGASAAFLRLRVLYVDSSDAASAVTCRQPGFSSFHIVARQPVSQSVGVFCSLKPDGRSLGLSSRLEPDVRSVSQSVCLPAIQMGGPLC